MPHFSLNPYVVPAQLGALLSEHLPSPHAFYILKQIPSAQVLCRLHPAGCPVFQPPFISQSVTACSVYQEIRKKMWFFHEGWHSLFSPFIPTDFFFFYTDVLYYLLSEFRFFDTSVWKSFRKCMCCLAYYGVRIGQVWIILHCREMRPLFSIIIKSVCTESFSLLLGYSSQLPYATW